MVDIHIYYHFPDDSVPAWAADMVNKVDQILELCKNMPTAADVKSKLDMLTAGVAAFPDVESSVEKLLANLAAEISTLKTAVTNADVPQAIIDQIDSIGTAITTHATKISADVVANTPAA